MKKIANLYLLIILLLGGTSCEGFLDQPVYGSLDADSFYKTEQECIYGLNGCYRSLMPIEWGQICILRVMSDMATDDCWAGNTTQNGEKYLEIAHYLFKGKANNEYVGNFYARNFKTIYNCNLIIKKITEAPFDNQEAKDEMIAEAKFLRAVAYFELVKNFGGVPLTSEPLTPIELHLSRSSVADTYDFIKKDLMEARKVLPVVAKEAGRATWGAATAYLAKANLYTEDWDLAEQYAFEVIDSGQYDLEDDFSDVWNVDNSNGKEAVFQIQYSNNSTFGQYGSYYTTIMGCRDDNGWSWGLPTSDLEKAYKDEGDDIRLKNTIMVHNQDVYGDPDALKYKITPAKHKSARVCRKYYIPKAKRTLPYNQPRHPLNYHMMRFADVLLIHAEAAYHNNNESGALASLKRVRDRVGLTTDMALTGDDLKYAIYKERRLEFACEGQRLYDLRRWKNPNDESKSMLSYIMGPTGTFVTRNMNESTADKWEWDNKKEAQNKGYYFEEGVHNLFPIPQTEIDLSGGLIEQNPM